MWVYQPTKDTDPPQFEVGFYSTHQGWWVPIERYANEADARALVNYLNGGDGKKLNIAVPNE